MNSEPVRARFVQIAGGAAAIVLWLASSALGAVILLVARELVIEMAYALDINPWAHGAIDKFAFVFLGLGWLVCVYVVEHVYRKASGVSFRKLLRTFALVTGIQVAFFILARLFFWLVR